jgi:hypothetical protein
LLLHCTSTSLIVICLFSNLQKNRNSFNKSAGKISRSYIEYAAALLGFSRLLGPATRRRRILSVIGLESGSAE